MRDLKAGLKNHNGVREKKLKRKSYVIHSQIHTSMEFVSNLLENVLLEKRNKISKRAKKFYNHSSNINVIKKKKKL